MIPFIGTSLGAALVFFMKRSFGGGARCALNGFAAGVMTAASVWSLILPAIDGSFFLGPFAFLPAIVGFWLGVGFMFLVGAIVRRINAKNADNGVIGVDLRTKTMIFAVTVHNVPEGFAVGVIFSGLLSGSAGVTLAGAMALSIGIAIQNFPEGAIVSMPLSSEGYGKTKSFLIGVISGVIEPIAALFAILFSVFVQPLMPYFLSFAAGAMIFVVVKDLVPEAAGDGAELSTLFFCLGFTIMASLDVAL